jgi:hypothetical protein
LKPRKSKVSGLPSPARFRFADADALTQRGRQHPVERRRPRRQLDIEILSIGGWPTLCPFAPPKVGCPTFRDFRKVGIRNDGITRLKFGLLEFVHEHGSAGDEVEVSGAVVALEFFGHRNLVTESSGLFV